ncbi:hypothetical protein EVJ32_04950 [Exiguobacterium sp. SH5S4]|uniref:hypothetical protein n=1 Tax=Exiguobacterium sp. SH5S4 TaxID=2510961 RepID=UPI00103A529E|nr:hypothetical protein [Exiguobacterium sp. SH5S4]TCI26725.1 hypothetical protein EVJ32_04950 [Exiguobacterium sp. SH5S4]
MKKMLVILGILIIVGAGIGYTMISGSASSEIPADRYGKFETFEADDRELIEYVIEYNKFNEELKTLDLTYAFILGSDDKLNQYELAMSYVELYTELQGKIYIFNKNNKVPSEYKTLHESLIKEIGIADLITEEYEDAIENEDFSKLEELMKISSDARKDGLASTDRIEYFEDVNEFILKN